MEILFYFLVFLKLYFWFIVEDGCENDMYYMVIVFFEFIKKIVVLVFKNMLISWVFEDYNKGCWLWFCKWNMICIIFKIIFFYRF